MFRILADVNVPGEYVSALQGDGHDVTYTQKIPELGPEATDDAIAEYAASEGTAILSTDLKDFAQRDLNVPLFVAPQTMSGGEIRAAVAQVEALPFDPAESEPIWLSAL